MRLLRFLALLPILALLGGCDMVLMNPSGDVALQQRNLVLISTGLMLLIIVPVIIATVLFAWRYRASSLNATYKPDWAHSTSLEVLIWTAPLLIIIALGALTWLSTHVLDPFRKISRVSAEEPLLYNVKPLEIDVVSLDWKWVFIYPDQGVATVNEVAAPVDQPIQFKITSGTVMNTFFIPALAGQIYSMAGMQTELNVVMNKEGVYDGYSGNYSGAGFSDMSFKFHGLSQKDFSDWVAKVKSQGKPLDVDAYRGLERPSNKVPVTYYSSVVPGLYDSILNLCVDPGKMCLGQMMAIDARGGQKADESGEVRKSLQYDGQGGGVDNTDEAPGATTPASGRSSHSETAPPGMKPTATAPEVKPASGGPDQNGDHSMEDMPGMSKAPADDAQSPAPDQLNKH